MQGLLQLAILIGGGIVSALISVRLKLPTILGYLIAGVVFSLALPKEYLQSELLGNFAQLGAALLLFAIGVEFSIDNIKKIRNIVVVGAILQAVIVLVVGMFVLGNLFGLSQFEAFFISALISTSSTAFVVKMLEGRGELFTYAGSIMTGWLVIQDLLVIIWFLLFETFAPNAGPEADLIMSLIRAALLIGIALVVGKYVLPKLMTSIAKYKSDELLLITTVGIIAAFAVLANSLGVSFTVGAFLAGLALSESLLQHEIFTEIRPLRNLFMMIFFVSIGMLFDVNVVLDNVPLMLAILALLLVVKAIVVTVISVWFNVHIKNSLRIGLGLYQIGEFAFLAAQIGLAHNWIDARIYSLLIAATVLSMVLTPVLYGNLDGIYKFVEAKLRNISPNLYRSLFVSSREEVFSEEELSDHVVVCGHGRVGKFVAEALQKSHIPFAVIEMDMQVAEKLNQEGINVVFGDSNNLDILKSSGIEKARALVVALPNLEDAKSVIAKAREINPKIKVVARSHAEDAGLNSSIGADTVVEPEFEAAIQIISNLYKLMNRGHSRVLEAVRKLKLGN